MQIIGITGPIASGKTTLANYFKEKGAIIIDADRIGHDLLLRSNIKNNVKKKFGKDAFSGNEIDRKKLASIAFSSKEQLEKLNEIMLKPIVNIIIDELNLFSKTLPANELVIIDAPLLFESGLDKYTEIIIMVTSSKEKQLERLLSKDYSHKQAINRIELQSSKKEFINKSDYVAINNGSLEELRNETEKIWHFIKELEKS